MHVFNTDCAAVGIAKDLEDVPKWSFLLATKTCSSKGAVEIPKA